jgi:hypothetical protein
MVLPGAYAEGRARHWAAHTLAEEPNGSPVSEPLLHLIWQYQRVRRDQLQATNGQTIRILHPGFWNHESGPDFRQAVIQFGDALAQNGDVEVDLSPQGWRAHGHQHNAAYRNVILHVVWDTETPAGHPVPTLALKPHLDAPVEELGSCLRREPRPVPTSLLGQCCPPLHHLTEAERTELLHQAAQVRLESKATQLRARARQVGWEQTLWEAIFGALGYKHNVWPMRRISEVLPTLRAELPHPGSVLAWQARLLGVSGLLPTDLRSVPAPGCSYLQRLWNVWWREREQFAEVTLPHSLWRLNGLRPANSPQRRLALAAHWLRQADLPARLAAWFSAAQSDSERPSSLLKILQVADDDFWSRHWTFRSRTLPYPQPLIGAQRVTDLAINVILPWFWIRATVGQNDSLRRLAEQCYFAWPQAEDNSVLRLARRRLFGDPRLPALNTAAMQQALLQIVRDFCDFSNAVCDHCPFPNLVRESVVGRI